VSTVLLWGTAIPAVRAGLRYYSPEHLALLRFATACLALAGYAWAARMRPPALRDIPGLAVTGLLAVFVYHMALNYGLKSVSAGPASVLVSTAPIYTALLGTLVLREPLEGRLIAGLLLSLGGATLIGFGEGGGIHFSIGVALLLLAALSLSLNVILQKVYLRRYGPLDVTCYSIWLGVVPLFAFGASLPAAIMRAPLAVTAGMVYLGVFPISLAYVAWAYVLSHLPAGRAASFTYLMPLISGVTAWIALGEVPTAASFGGAGLILAGVLAVNLKRRVPESVTPVG
jgi:drug/metabolite transporter (DMT)-like permease